LGEDKLSAGRFIAGYVGRLVEEKGIDEIIDAMLLLPHSVTLLVAGSGPLDERIRSLGDQVRMLGVVRHPELWRAYASMDCLLLPSRTTDAWMEQFGYVLAEAMALGIPIIGSDSGAIPEVIGPAGLIVPEREPAALAAAIRQLASDPAQAAQLGAEGRARYRALFSLDALADRVAALL
jgi:glycosyltransferase involved in cell wall biosynthesis